MKTTARSLGGRAAIAAALVGVSMLGNLRLHASEAPRHPLAAVVATSAVADPGAHRFVEAGVVSGSDSDAEATAVDRGAAADDADDDGRLVPAIYAWDPDVRFVYYRHVSKWM